MSERTSSATAIVGEPEVLEDEAGISASELIAHPAWRQLKAAAISLQAHQLKDGSIPDEAAHPQAGAHVETIRRSVIHLGPLFAHDAAYLATLDDDFGKWEVSGFAVPDFLDALTAFQPQQKRVNGMRHLVVFPMVTQNGSSSRLVEAVLIEVIWPEFVAELEAGEYSNRLFVPIRFLDFTPGYDTNSAVLFPETVAMREIPTFTWGRSSPTARPSGSAGSCGRRQPSPGSNCRRTPRRCSTTSSSPKRPS